MEKPWWERDGESHRRNRVLLGMEEGDIDFGPYGLGSERSLRDYERYAGLNFKLRGAQPYTLDHGEPPNPVMADEKAWLGSFLKNYNRANKRLFVPGVMPRWMSTRLRTAMWPTTPVATASMF